MTYSFNETISSSYDSNQCKYVNAGFERILEHINKIIVNQPTK